MQILFLSSQTRFLFAVIFPWTWTSSSRARNETALSARKAMLISGYENRGT